MRTGYIKLHRSIMDNFLYKEKRVFSKYEAWQDILLNVNFDTGKTIIKGKLYEVKSGESLLSMDSWASRWMWNKSSVRRFFKLLQESEMIIINSDNITTHLTVCNWERYQVERNANETQTKRKRNAKEFQTTPIKEEEEEKECEEEINTVKPTKVDFDFIKFLSFLNTTLGKKHTVINEKVRKNIRARLKDGYTKDNFLNTIINLKDVQTHKDNNYTYCTPEFISRADTLDKYGYKSDKGTQPIYTGR